MYTSMQNQSTEVLKAGLLKLIDCLLFLSHSRIFHIHRESSIKDCNKLCLKSISIINSLGTNCSKLWNDKAKESKYIKHMQPISFLGEETQGFTNKDQSNLKTEILGIFLYQCYDIIIMCLLIFNGFSGEQCGSWASCIMFFWF